MAFVARLSGLRAVAERCGYLLKTRAFNTISDAVRRASSLRVVRAMVARLETTHQPGWEELVALDGMALTLPGTQRHGCAKFNNQTVGGGVVWAWMINAARGMSPVKVLKIVRGAWCDSKVMREVPLLCDGPVYLMDRGFYALELLDQWLTRKVHFIVRVRESFLIYKEIRAVSAPRAVGTKRLQLDAIVRLGAEQAKAHPEVRLLIVRLASGENLILATERLEWSAERILDAYRQRWHIERFHRFLKDTLGLSHLYSFEKTGMEFLLYTALLVSLLLFFATNAPQGEVIRILRARLKATREGLWMTTPWKRNTIARNRQGRKNSKRSKTAER